MGEAAKTYADYELEVSIKMDPIYSLIAMIPCAKLWPWIGEQLRPSEVRIAQLDMHVYSTFYKPGFPAFVGAGAG